MLIARKCTISRAVISESDCAGIVRELQFSRAFFIRYVIKRVDITEFKCIQYMGLLQSSYDQTSYIVSVADISFNP